MIIFIIGPAAFSYNYLFAPRSSRLKILALTLPGSSARWRRELASACTELRRPIPNRTPSKHAQHVIPSHSVPSPSVTSIMVRNLSYLQSARAHTHTHDGAHSLTRTPAIEVSANTRKKTKANAVKQPQSRQSKTRIVDAAKNLFTLACFFASLPSLCFLALF